MFVDFLRDLGALDSLADDVKSVREHRSILQNRHVESYVISLGVLTFIGYVSFYEGSGSTFINFASQDRKGIAPKSLPLDCPIHSSLSPLF